MDPIDLQNLPSQLHDTYAQGGWLGVASVVVYLAMKLARSRFVQFFLPTKWRWDNLPAWERWASIVGVSAVGGTLHMVASGLGLFQAAWGSVIAAVGAIGVDQTIKALGRSPEEISLPPNQPTFTNREPPEL